MLFRSIAIVTSVSHSHLEYFGSVNNIKKEKQVLVESLEKNGLAILNFDSELVKEMAKISKAPVLSYGIKDKEADFLTQDIVYNLQKEIMIFPELLLKSNTKAQWFQLV